MKIYTTKFNANEPTNKQINIPNFSTAKIGVQVEKNGQIVELSGSQINLVDGNTVISSDGNYNGYATFPITTGNQNEDKNFILSCDKGYDVNVSEPFKSNFNLTVNSDKNTVFDVDKDTVTPSYILPKASASTLGGIKVGANLAIDSNGVLSASGGSRGCKVWNVGTNNLQYESVPFQVGDLIVFDGEGAGSYWQSISKDGITYVPDFIIPNNGSMCYVYRMKDDEIVIMYNTGSQWDYSYFEPQEEPEE